MEIFTSTETIVGRRKLQLRNHAQDPDKIVKMDFEIKRCILAPSHTKGWTFNLIFKFKSQYFLF